MDAESLNRISYLESVIELLEGIIETQEGVIEELYRQLEEAQGKPMNGG